MAQSKEELKPLVDKFVGRFLGFHDASVVSAAVRSIYKGYDHRKTVDKLSSHMDHSKALKFTESLFKTFRNDEEPHKKSRKRHRVVEEPEVGEKKKPRSDPDPDLPKPQQALASQLTNTQIQEMMANAQKMIEERKKQMLMVGLPPSQPVDEPPPENNAEPSLSENKARIAQLTAMIQARLSSKPTLLSNWTPEEDDSKQHKPAPLILDSEGRTLDMTGKEVHLTHHMPTLKANIRAQKRAQFKVTNEKVMEELYEQKFFDPRVSSKSFQRSKKGFKFHEKGKFQQLAQRLRTKAQLEKLQEEIAQAAKKTGISSATKLALIVPRKEHRAPLICCR